MLYRVFPWDPTSEPRPLDIPVGGQGSGRHDNVDQYLAIYLARDPESAVAERIQAFRGGDITPQDLIRRDGRTLSLASIDDSALSGLIDLDDPAVLVGIGRRPSQVATTDRRATQRLALELFLGGATGVSWWSILEAGWTNVTLFDVRLAAGTLLVEDSRPLTIEDPDLLAAADRLGIRTRP